MDRKKLAVFILTNILIGAGLVFIVFLNIFELQGLSRVVTSILAFAAGGVALYLLSSWSAGKKDDILIGTTEAAESVLITGRAAVAAYLNENKSTPYFREKLTLIINRIDTVLQRCEGMTNMITERFGAAGLSYGKFAAPIDTLQTFLGKQVNNLISRMKMFNEEEYSARISEFTRGNRKKDASDYEILEQEYKDYTENTLAAFDTAVLKIDQLALEMSKLSEWEADKAMDILHDLDTLIQETKLYK